MAYDSAATRTRLLDAAYREFSERGLAGARVDRIAELADANKQAIYAYFGSKDALFDAVLDQRLGILADRVPFTPDDPVAYFLGLFDYFADEPDLIRLTRWKDLERADAAPAEVQSHLDKARQIARSRDLSDEQGLDLFMLALAMTVAWSATAPSIRRGRGKSRLQRHRHALGHALAAVVA